MNTISIGPRQRPTWVRGPAHVEDGEIVLDETRARPYVFFEPDQCEDLLLDLAELRHLGSLVDLEVTNPEPAVTFARRHGLLWHSPEEVGSGKCRESLRDWLIEGHDVSMSMGLYMKLRESIEAGSAEPLRQYLLPLRDFGWFWGAIPQDPEEFVNGISIILAERINAGMSGCNQTFVAACSLVKDGAKVGSAGDFRYSVDPKNLVAAAYNEFASLIVERAVFKECAGCGELFRSKHGNRAYCEPNCSERTRKRRQRAHRSNQGEL